tara:strand:+ start:181 stop:579 length:399 start_codon:yes stop_codon:yes gene_type:complete
MDMSILAPLLITAIVAIIGWFIAHQLSMSRDLKNKRTDLKVKYLIEAYRKLENISHREDPNMQDFETAIADIQLLGSQKQVELAQNIAKEFAKTKCADMDDLLKDLRQNLRKVLGLEELSSQDLTIVRWKSN